MILVDRDPAILIHRDRPFWSIVTDLGF